MLTVETFNLINHTLFGHPETAEGIIFPDDHICIVKYPSYEQKYGDAFAMEIIRAIQGRYKKTLLHMRDFYLIDRLMHEVIWNNYYWGANSNFLRAVLESTEMFLKDRLKENYD